MYTIRIHYKDQKRNNYERLISKTVLYLTLTASVMIFYLWREYPGRVSDSFLASSLFFLLLQYPIFKILHLRERKRVITVSGSHLTYFEGKKKIEMELNSTLSIAAKSFFGFLPFIHLKNGEKQCTIPIIMDGVEQLPSHILEHKEDRQALRHFILYYKSVGKYIDMLSQKARKIFPILTFFSFMTAYSIWAFPLEVVLFWMLISFVMPMFAVTTAYLLLKIVISANHKKRVRTYVLGISFYLTLIVYLTYGILFRGLILS